MFTLSPYGIELGWDNNVFSLVCDLENAFELAPFLWFWVWIRIHISIGAPGFLLYITRKFSTLSIVKLF